MAETITWQGASGTAYEYAIFELPISLDPCEGNYIFCKQSGNTWYAIYIGEGELSERVSDDHHKASCIEQKGATHVHAHENSNENSRTSEEADLLKQHTEAYAPKGCNEKIGG